MLPLHQPEKVESRVNPLLFRAFRKTKRVTPPDIQQEQTPLLLVPRGALGDRVWVVALCRRVAEAGGASVLQQRFGSSHELRASV